ncbi:GntR family transcriptional regulator [Alcaligenaceae bacterium]|nr:GntR family transcriptional regulator [Alcaligenaceae bacterium]
MTTQAAKEKRSSDAANGIAVPSAEFDSKNAADHAYHVIEARIVQIEYPPDFMLSEQQLGNELGISRTPIREALRRLADDKLIQILPRKGAFVTHVEIKQYLHLLDLRHQIERFAATRAAKRRSEEQARHMHNLINELKEGIMAPDQAVFVYSDKAYKDLIVEATGNPFLGGVIAPMHAHSRRFWYYHRNQWSSHEAELAIERHLNVMEAVAMGDEDAADVAVQKLFEYLEAFALRVLKSEHTI